MNRMAVASVCLIVFLGLAAASCHSARRRGEYSAVAAESAIRLDEQRYFGTPCHQKNLTVWPILAERTVEVGDFLSLKEAQDRSLAIVREVGAPAPVGRSDPAESETEYPQPPLALEAGPASEADPARVNQLVIENRGDLPLLVCGGTVLKGGNQDRLIARDFVIAPEPRRRPTFSVLRRGGGQVSGTDDRPLLSSRPRKRERAHRCPSTLAMSLTSQRSGRQWTH